MTWQDDVDVFVWHLRARSNTTCRDECNVICLSVSKRFLLFFLSFFPLTLAAIPQRSGGVRTCPDVLTMSSLRLRAGSVSCSWAPTAGWQNCRARPSCTRLRLSARSCSRRRRRRPWRSASWSVRNSRRSWRYDTTSGRETQHRPRVRRSTRERESPRLSARHMRRAKITMGWKTRQEWASLIKTNYNEQNCRVSASKRGWISLTERKKCSFCLKHQKEEQKKLTAWLMVHGGLRSCTQ